MADNNEKDRVNEATERLRKNLDDVTSGFGEKFTDIKDEAEDLFQDAVKKSQQGAKLLKSQIKNHPFRSLAVALVVGFIAGAILSSDHDD